jgi:hypothetical protein
MPPKKDIAPHPVAPAPSSRTPGTALDKINGLLRRQPSASGISGLEDSGLDTRDRDVDYPLLVHAIYLVAATWRAQLHIPQHAHVAADTHGDVPLSPSVVTPLMAPPQPAVERTIAFDRRFALAVALHVNQTITLDHVARSAALFPEWVIPTWFIQPPSFIVDPSGDALQASSLGSASAQSSVVRSDISCRIKLPLSKIPTVEEARQNLHTRHASTSSVAGVLALHCAQSALEDQWRAGQDEDTQPVQFSGRSGGVKRSRETTPRPSAASSESPSVFLSSVPEALRNVLAAEKLTAVLTTLNAEAKALKNNDEERIAAAIEKERLLAFFDLLRATFGVSRASLGGEKLIEILVSQNSVAASEASVRRQLWRLLKLSAASGLTANLVAEGSGLIQSEGGLTEANLHEAVFSLDRAVSSRARMTHALSIPDRLSEGL